MLRQTGKIMTKSLVITNRLSFTIAGLIIDYRLKVFQVYPVTLNTTLLQQMGHHCSLFV